MITAPRARRRAGIAAALFAPALVLAGCSSDGNTDGGGSENSTALATRTFEDSTGPVEIPAEPQRIIALARAVPSLLEVEAPLVGVSTYDDMVWLEPEQLATYEELPNVGLHSELNYEQIAALDPDLIISGIPARVFASIDQTQLRAIAPVLDLGPLTPADWRNYGAKMADASGASAEFGKQKEEYEGLAAEVHDKYADKIDGVSFAAVDVYESIDPGMYSREFTGSYTTNIAEDAGLVFEGTASDGDGTFSEDVSVENLGALADYDVLVYPVQPDGTPNEQVQQLLDSDSWKALPAVQAGRVLPIAYTDALTYPGAMKTLDSLAAALEALPAEQPAE